MPEQEHTCYYCSTVNTTTSECCATCGSELILQQRYLLRRVAAQCGIALGAAAGEAACCRCSTGALRLA